MSVFNGCCTALVTPFTTSGVDYAALEKLVDFQLKGGVNALCILGTTGEPATMTEKERNGVIDFVVERVAHRIPVIVGSGSNSTALAVEHSQNAEKHGADGVLVVTPYYNKCTQKGLLLHYGAVCDSVGIPVIAYNVPTRTKVNIEADTAKKLCELKNMSGIKEASGDIDQVQAMAAAVKGGMDFYIGDDSLTLIAFCLGASGLISVASNPIPDVMSALTALCAKGDYEKARAIQFELMPLMSALFCEVNPIPVKKAMQLIGIDCGLPRLPLTEMEKEHTEKLEKALKDLGRI